MKIHWSEIAEADLDDIYDYIAGMCLTMRNCLSIG